MILGGAAASLAPACLRTPPVTGRALRHRAVESVTVAWRGREGAGFPVRRPFPTGGLALMDPFVLLDEMGPVRWAPGEAKGAPDHPHRGFETVTYMLTGEFQHRDSLGNHGRLTPGDVQWMTAGGGIVHSEMPADRIVAGGGDIHGFQLWVNLPARLKRTSPRYQEVARSHIPLGGTDDGRVHARVIAGEALGVRAVIDTHTPMIYQHWSLGPGARVDHRVAADHNVGVFVFRGSAELGESRRAVREGELAVMSAGDVVRLGVSARSQEPAQMLVLAGVPIGEPVARGGPFVMNTDEEVRQAFEDYRAGRMGVIPG